MSGQKASPAGGVPLEGQQHLERISSDRDICGGKPVFRGTRVRVSDILDMIADMRAA